MVLPTADVLGKEAAAHSRLLGRCVQGQPNNWSKLFGEYLFFSCERYWQPHIPELKATFHTHDYFLYFTQHLRQ